jgi:hypothetical protein
MVVLVPFVPRGKETEATKPESVNMMSKELKQHSLIRIKELQLGIQ